MKHTFFSLLAIVFLVSSSFGQVSWSKYSYTIPNYSFYSSNLIIDNNNNKWFSLGVQFSKLVKFDGSNFSIVTEIPHDDNWDTREFAFDSDDNIYELYETSLKKFDGISFTTYNITSSMRPVSNSLIIDSQDNVWFIGGNFNGISFNTLSLIKFDGSTFISYDFDSNVNYYSSQAGGSGFKI
jgi:hypothetical protein